MKQYLIGLSLLFFITGCTHHARLYKDQLVTNICNSFDTDDAIEPDSIKVSRIFSKHLLPYLPDISEDSAAALYNFLYIRLQKDCVSFKEISDRLSDGKRKSDWRDVDKEPESELSAADADHFFNTRHLKYLEVNGDTTNAFFTDSTWEDHFKDGTFSRLTFNKLNQNEFVISFIESNNSIRMNLSKPGDQYRYKVIKKENGYYTMFVQAAGSRIKSLFKLYY